jgi:copper oxidase (laccase) domain-containing protein
MNREVTVLEQSTNTHVTTSPVEVVAEFQNMSTMVLKPNGHHHTVATQPHSNQVIKITQQEYNPVLRAMQNAFD